MKHFYSSAYQIKQLIAHN